MKKLFATNGYTVYEATTRDENKYNVCAGAFYIYFSSDIREYGLSNSDYEFECGTLEEVHEQIESCGNYARAKEVCESLSTCVSYEDIDEMCAIMDANADASDDEIIDIIENTGDDESIYIVSFISDTTRRTTYVMASCEVDAIRIATAKIATFERGFNPNNYGEIRAEIRA